MKIIGAGTTILMVIGKQRIPLVTLQSAAQVKKTLLWTRGFDTAIEGASALLDYCNEQGLKPKGRVIGKKRCPELAGMKANYSK